MRLFLFICCLVVLVACRPAEDAPVLPTLRPIETFTPSPAPTDAPAQATPTVAPTETPHATPTITLFPTLTPSPSLSPTLPPTTAPTDRPTETPLPIELEISAPIGAFVRAGPGTDYEIVGEFLTGDRLPVVAYEENLIGERWYLVILPDASEAWVAASVAEVIGEGNDKRIALAATRPPTATISPTPSDTPTITPTPLPTLPQGANARVIGDLGVNIREGAGYDFPVLQTLDTDDPLVVIGRTPDSVWYEVVSFEEEQRTGWSLAELIELGFPAESLAVTWFDELVAAAGWDFVAQGRSSSRVACGMNIHPPSGVGYPQILNDLGRADWVRMPFTASPRYHGSLAEAFAYFDPIINAYNRLGAQVLLVLTHETYGEAAGWDWGAMTANDWRDFTTPYTQTVRQVAAHFGTRVAAYEIWNEGDAEPGNPTAVTIPPASLARIISSSARAIREVAPDATIVLGGLLDPSGTYLQRVKNALGGRLTVDAIGIHPYGRGAPDDDTAFTNFGDIGEVIRAYARVAPQTPLWITEIGAGGDNRPERWGEAARYMVNLWRYVQGFHAGRVENIIWYAWSDGMQADQRLNGLVDTSGNPKDPIYDTFFNLCGS